MQQSSLDYKLGRIAAFVRTTTGRLYEVLLRNVTIVNKRLQTEVTVQSCILSNCDIENESVLKLCDSIFGKWPSVSEDELNALLKEKRGVTIIDPQDSFFLTEVVDDIAFPLVLREPLRDQIVTDKDSLPQALDCCPVCLADVYPLENAELRCKHPIHLACFLKIRDNRCPICRRDVVPQEGKLRHSAAEENTDVSINQKDFVMCGKIDSWLRTTEGTLCEVILHNATISNRITHEKKEIAYLLLVFPQQFSKPLLSLARSMYDSHLPTFAEINEQLQIEGLCIVSSFVESQKISQMLRIPATSCCDNTLTSQQIKEITGDIRLQ